MKMRSWFLRNWFGIFGIAIGFLIAYYFYSKSIIRREPIFIVDPSRTEILNSARISQSPVRVIKQNGDEIKSDLTAVKFYFWNNGKAPIKKADILKNISIALDDPNGEIIETRILKTSREITNVRLSPSKNNPSTVIDIDFSILEYRDGITGQIIFAGSPKANFNISGIIEGAREIRSSESVARSKFWLDFLRYVFYGVFIIIGFIIFVSFMNFLEKRVFAPMRAKNIKISDKTQNIIGVSLLVLFVLGLILAFIFQGIGEMRETARKSITELVPGDIIPSNR